MHRFKTPAREPVDVTVTDVDAHKVSKTAFTVQYSTLKEKLSRLKKKKT